jgi:hypothetical protein
MRPAGAAAIGNMLLTAVDGFNLAMEPADMPNFCIS